MSSPPPADDESKRDLETETETELQQHPTTTVDDTTTAIALSHALNEKDASDIENQQLPICSRSNTAREPEDANIVTWTSSTDPADPLNFPPWQKWTLIWLSSAMNFMTGLSSAMFAPGVPRLMAEFGSADSSLAAFVVTIFVLGLAMGPVVFAPLSELYGRLPVQLVGCFGFLVFSVGCALSTSLDMLIGMRLMQGIFAAVPLTNGGGLVADMFVLESRGFAMSMFTLGVLVGPIVGPIAGGFVAASLGWRWVFWIITIVLGVLSGLSLFFWRETYAPVLLGRKAALLRKETGNMALRSVYESGLSPRAHFQQGIGRALKMLVYSPVILAVSIHMGLAYTYFYILFTTFTPVFRDTYDFTESTVGLSFIGVGIGFLIGQVVCAKGGDAIMVRLAKGNQGKMKPEYRLPLCFIGGCFIPVGLFWFGWAAQARVHWIVPIIGTTFLGFGNSLLFISIQNYTVDAFTLYAASALAGNTIVRSIMATVVPLAAPRLYEVLGLGWGNSVLAFVAVAMIPLPGLMFFYGERMRGWNSARMNRL